MIGYVESVEYGMPSSQTPEATAQWRRHRNASHFFFLILHSTIFLR